MTKRIDRQGGGTEGPRILWIDDELNIRKNARAWLAQLLPQVTVFIVEGNDEALDLLREHCGQFDLVVQDCDRPLGRCLGGDSEKSYRRAGIRFEEEILNVDFQDIPVVYCTGDVSFAPEGAVVWQKPFRVKELPDLILSNMRSRA